MNSRTTRVVVRRWIIAIKVTDEGDFGFKFTNEYEWIMFYIHSDKTINNRQTLLSMEMTYGIASDVMINEM